MILALNTPRFRKVIGSQLMRIVDHFYGLHGPLSEDPKSPSGVGLLLPISNSNTPGVLPASFSFYSLPSSFVPSLIQSLVFPQVFGNDFLTLFKPCHSVTQCDII